MQATMKALVLRQHGSLDALEVITDRPLPRASAGHVVIRVRASLALALRDQIICRKWFIGFRERPGRGLIGPRILHRLVGLLGPCRHRAHRLKRRQCKQPV